ncbi:hypothetical protein C8R44DRAFT_887404 [Mycena epipterygia]|nr:hypothetical protein C8R44DRAFT_887404 [Mycena epipterygia]
MTRQLQEISRETLAAVWCNAHTRRNRFYLRRMYFDTSLTNTPFGLWTFPRPILPAPSPHTPRCRSLKRSTHVRSFPTQSQSVRDPTPAPTMLNFAYVMPAVILSGARARGDPRALLQPVVAALYAEHDTQREPRYSHGYASRPMPLARVLDGTYFALVKPDGFT